MNGTIESTTTDWRGDTLTVALISSDTEIAVSDTSDFDEDGGWLTIADDDPIEYLSCDEDASTVTLAGTVGAAFEAGDPVAVWDPTVPRGGAKVVEYLATVMTDRGPAEAVIPHELIPLAGIENLIGASVALAEGEDGEWYVGQVFGREASIDPANVGSPMFQAYLPTSGGRAGGVNIPNNLWTVVDDWDVAAPFDTSEFEFDGDTLTCKLVGEYDAPLIARWVGNTTGRRQIRIIRTEGGVESEEVSVTNAPPDDGAVSQTIPLKFETTVPHTTFRVEAYQNSGGSLALQGEAPGKKTFWRVSRKR